MIHTQNSFSEHKIFSFICVLFFSFSIVHFGLHCTALYYCTTLTPHRMGLPGCERRRQYEAINTQLNCDKWPNWAEIDTVILEPQQCISDNYGWCSTWWGVMYLTDFTWLVTHIRCMIRIIRILASVSPHLPLLTVNARNAQNSTAVNKTSGADNDIIRNVPRIAAPLPDI